MYICTFVHLVQSKGNKATMFVGMNDITVLEAYPMDDYDKTLRRCLYLADVHTLMIILT